MGLRNYVLDGGQWEWAILGVVQPIEKQSESLLAVVYVAKRIICRQ